VGLAAVLAAVSLLPAKQRETHPHDWMTTDTELACPDPHCGARFRITRTGRSAFRHGEVTRVPLDRQLADDLRHSSGDASADGPR
jgi:hypothetical protein